MIPAVIPKGKVIYDDDCGICRAFRKTAERKAVQSKFEFIPRRDADPDDYLPYSKPADFPETIIFIDSSGHSYKGIAAISQILSQIKKPWSIFGRMLSLPVVRPVAALVYKIGAGQRNRISRTLKLK